MQEDQNMTLTLLIIAHVLWGLCIVANRRDADDEAAGIVHDWRRE